MATEPVVNEWVPQCPHCGHSFGTPIVLGEWAVFPLPERFGLTCPRCGLQFWAGGTLVATPKGMVRIVGNTNDPIGTALARLEELEREQSGPNRSPQDVAAGHFPEVVTQLDVPQSQRDLQGADRPTLFEREVKTGRNDPCPCGSGKKFKQCHGKPN